MQRLASRDIERVRVFLEETAVACDLATFGSTLLPAVQRLVPSVIACYAQIDPAQAKLVAQEVYPKVQPPKDRGAFERHMFEHPVFEEWERTGVTSVLRRSDLLSKAEWHRRGIYNEVYRAWSCEDSLPIGLPAPEGLIACICLERGTDFTDLEVKLLDLVRPHVVQMYRNAEMFSLLGDVTRSREARSIVLDKAGRPLIATQEAWDLLSAYFPGYSAQGAFPGPVRSWLEGELSRWAWPQEVPPPPSPYIAETLNGDRLNFRLMVGRQTGEQALLILEEQCVKISPQASPHLGLSPREEQVLLLVRKGHRSSEIAEILVVSRRTVEKHLENIYCKLGVDNRTAAVAAAFSTAASAQSRDLTARTRHGSNR